MVGLIMNTNTQTVSTEVALELVTDQCRQQILHHLIENGNNAVDIDDLMDNLDVAEMPEDRSRSTSRQHLKTRLHHTHLPKLAEAGVIDYDAHSDTVRYYSTERVEKLTAFITDELR